MKTNCPNCGAPIDYSKEKCEYCGTYYERDDSECDVLYVDNKFDALRETAFKKFLEYEKKHNKTPNYIIMPVWAAEMINSSYEKEIVVEDLCMRKIVIKFLGMVICVSSKIQTLDEIEVFCEEDEVQY